MPIFDLVTKKEVNQLSDSCVAILTNEEAKSHGYSMAYHPISKVSPMLTMHFVELVDSDLQPSALIFDFQKIIYVCDDPTTHRDEIKTLIETFETSQLPHELLTYGSDRNFETMIKVEEILSDIEDSLYDSDKTILSDINRLRSECLEYSRMARRNVFESESFTGQNDMIINIDYAVTISHSVYNHAMHLLDLIQHVTDSYNAYSQDRNNTILNRLTLVTLFTTPFTLLAGLYGMNFGNMPLVYHPNGPLIVLSIMFMSSLLIYVILKAKKII